MSIVTFPTIHTVTVFDFLTEVHVHDCVYLAWLVRVCTNTLLPSARPPAHSCKQPRSPANADVVGLDLPSYGYTLVYTCQSGYFLSGGSEHRVCRSDGSWTGKVPVCRGTWLAEVHEGSRWRGWGGGGRCIVGGLWKCIKVEVVHYGGVNWILVYRLSSCELNQLYKACSGSYSTLSWF